MTKYTKWSCFFEYGTIKHYFNVCGICEYQKGCGSRIKLFKVIQYQDTTASEEQCFFLIDAPTRAVRFKKWSVSCQSQTDHSTTMSKFSIVYYNDKKTSTKVYMTLSKMFVFPNVLKFFEIVKLKTLKHVLNCMV